MSHLNSCQEIQVRVDTTVEVDDYEIAMNGRALEINLKDVQVDQDADVEVVVDDDMVLEAFGDAGDDDLRAFMDLVAADERYGRIMLAAVLADASGDGYMILDDVVRECFEAAEKAGITLAHEPVRQMLAIVNLFESLCPGEKYSPSALLGYFAVRGITPATVKRMRRPEVEQRLREDAQQLGLLAPDSGSNSECSD